MDPSQELQGQKKKKKEEFLTIEIPRVASTIKMPLTIKKLLQN